jgi:ribonuclease D
MAKTLFSPSGTIHLHRQDLPPDLSFGPRSFGPVIAVDTETMGLDPRRDRLCLVQISSGDGVAHLVQIVPGGGPSTNLKALMEDAGVVKLFHFARFDVAALYEGIGATVEPVRCTKIASKLVRTYTDRHGLKDLCRDLLGVDISKQQQTSDWGAPELTPEQCAYAASDVLHLHALWARLEALLKREGRLELAEACFRFLPARGKLDLLGYEDPDIFAH